jgi:hypothetical protein
MTQQQDDEIIALRQDVGETMIRLSRAMLAFSHEMKTLANVLDTFITAVDRALLIKDSNNAE